MRLRDTLLLSLSIYCAYSPDCQGFQADFEVSSEAALLVNVDSGAILFEKNSDKRLYPASITKIVTALYVVAENQDFLDEVATVEWDDVASISTKAKREANFSHPSHWLETGATHMGLKVGEQMRIRDLLNGMLVASANDAANVIARYLGGTINNYMTEVNQYIHSLGCTSSTFVNPSGLHHPRQMTSAWDMALIAREALRYPLFRQVVSQTSWRRPETNKQDQTLLAQGNRMLRRGEFFYSPAIGIKTGYTSDAKNTFVAAAEFQGRTLLAVLLRSDRRADIFHDAQALFEWAFAEQLLKKQLIPEGFQSFALSLPDANGALRVLCNEAINVEYYPLEEPHFQVQVKWNEGLSVPITAGTEVGRVVLIGTQEQELASRVLYAGHDLKLDWLASGRNLATSLYRSWWTWVIGACISLGFLLFRR